MAGALPFVFPTVSLHEAFTYPTSMLLRNLMSMDVEEMLKALPLDAVVMIGGCDKTIPAELMGAVSADVPVDRSAGRLDAGGTARRHAARRLHRLPPAVGAASRRHDRRRRPQPRA